MPATSSMLRAAGRRERQPAQGIRRAGTNAKRGQLSVPSPSLRRVGNEKTAPPSAAPPSGPPAGHAAPVDTVSAAAVQTGTAPSDTLPEEAAPAGTVPSDTVSGAGAQQGQAPPDTLAGGGAPAGHPAVETPPPHCRARPPRRPVPRPSP